MENTGRGILSEIKQRRIQTNGIELNIAEAGEGPLVIMLHGFPESWYSWRHQLKALADAGYWAVATDNRGYGASDKPHEIEAYDQVTIAADVAGLIDALGRDSAVVVGHDWGAPAAWYTALLHPEKVSAVAALSVPWRGRGEFPPTQSFKAIYKDNFFYMLYFQEPGVAEAELEADVRRSLRLFYFGISGNNDKLGAGFVQKKKGDPLLKGMIDPDELPAWLSEEDMDFYTARFEASGFRGPLNWYRNLDSTWEKTANIPDFKITQPAFFMGGERDPVLAFSPNWEDIMRSMVPNLQELTVLPNCGHWIQQERPDEVNTGLIKFLKAN